MFDLNLEIEENVDIVQEFLPTLTFKAHEGRFQFPLTVKPVDF